MSRPRTIALSAVAIAAAAGALAACSSSGTAGGPGSSTPSGTPTTSTPAPTSSDATAATTRTTTVTASNAGSTRSGSGSSGSQCAESQLRAGVRSNPIAGVARHVVKVTFTNISRSTCTLTGFPGAAIEDSSNHQVTQATRVVGGVVGGTVEQNLGSVTVRPGATVFAWLEGQSTREKGAAQAGCGAPKYPRILVTPPNTSTPVPFSIGWPQCTAFDIHPVRAQ